MSGVWENRGVILSCFMIFMEKNIVWNGEENNYDTRHRKPAQGVSRCIYTNPASRARLTDKVAYGKGICLPRYRWREGNQGLHLLAGRGRIIILAPYRASTALRRIRPWSWRTLSFDQGYLPP